MLWYLHLCATAGVAVTGYADTAARTMTMDETGGGGQFTEVVLRPAVTVADPSMTGRAQALHAEIGRWPMTAVFAVDACRTPVGKIKGALAGVRPDHLTADVIRALMARNDWLDPGSVDDVYWGAANQAGEDNRNVARMGVLLAGLPVEIPGATVNRLCGSGMEAISGAARAIAAGDANIRLAGGSESMTGRRLCCPGG